MKPQIRLKWFVSLVFLALGLALVVGYTLISANYFKLGMDNMIASNMEKALQQYLRNVPVAERRASDVYDGYPVSMSWDRQPLTIRQHFAQAPQEPGILHKNENGPGLKPPEAVYFTLRNDINGETWYISHQLSRHTVSALVDRNIRRSLDSLLLTSALTAAALAVILWLTLHRVSRPVAALGAWTRGLNADNLNQPTPDFAYPELNELAELIRTSLSSVQEGLEREHNFLRHTSHELRTPISVLRNNIELIHRLDRNDADNTMARRQEALERIDRASLTMKHLTETLLWLSRDDCEALPKQRIALDGLLEQLVADMRYLLQHKPVKIVLNTQSYTMELPEVAARIVIGNLIRNAFQHTWQGEVIIIQQQNRIEIFNSVLEENSPSDQDLGFGLGLQLTAQLCEKLSWHYESGIDARGYRASVTLSG